MTENKKKVTTQVKETKKPHEKFTQITKFHSTPVTLITEAETTKTTIKDLTPNPLKYSFGKALFSTGTLEAYIYPLKRLDSVLWSFEKNPLAKGNYFATDLRKLKEIHCLREKIRYFLSLSKERKLEYLRKHGFSANISMEKDN